MPISMRRRWTRPSSRVALLAGLLGPAALAGVADEPHLNIVPRTVDEAVRVAAITAPVLDFSVPQPFEALSAGAATVAASGDQDVFSQPSGNIGFESELQFRLGNAMFQKLWVSSPSSTKASDGLGPLYNARSCQRCHIRDGRGHPPDGDGAVSFLMRISVPGGAGGVAIEDYLATVPEPIYGGQIQDFALPGHAPEARPRVEYQERAVTLSDGETASLRVPAYHLEDLAYGPVDADAMLSPRVAPQMIGLGLLETIPAADILSLADPQDADGDGVSGRANVVWSQEFGQPMLGRFGHKAGQPSVNEQVAAAFAGDIGISTPIFPAAYGDCTQAQQACRDAPHGDKDVRVDEVDQAGLDLTTYYSRNLAVPARRGVDDPQVLRGKRVFNQTGCAACHQPAFVTHRLEDRPEQSFQLIWPYSDLLLHDMGEGLADHRPEARATGREWRTAPLWGIGLTAQVSGHSLFLHDGRARSLLEAVLWHGGEAQAARDAVIAMPKPDRDALIRFLESL